MKKLKIDWGFFNKKTASWISWYAETFKQKALVVGVSGGVDSALVSYLCALSGMRTIVVSMPIHQPETSLERANEHIKWLMAHFPNVEPLSFDLTEEFDLMDKKFSDKLGVNKLVSANLRSRLRMNTLYAVAGNFSGIVVGTGNKVEDFGIGFFTKYGDGGVDISPIGRYMKSEVYAMASEAGIISSILEAKPTDDLWEGGTTDEQQIGATYDELEVAMETFESLGKKKFEVSGREKEVMDIFTSRHKANAHKMEPIPVFDADDLFAQMYGHRPTKIEYQTEEA